MYSCLLGSGYCTLYTESENTSTFAAPLYPSAWKVASNASASAFWQVVPARFCLNTMVEANAMNPGIPSSTMQRYCSFRESYEGQWRSEEHTSELQSLRHLVCRLLLAK